MVIDRLDDRLTMRQAAYMFGHQSDVICSRMQSSDTSSQASSPVKNMIIVETDMRNTFLPEDSHHTISQSRFP